MRLLLDTHAFLWFVAKSNELSFTARNYIENGSNEIYLSIASLWEISIKTSLGKLAIKGSYESVIEDVIEKISKFYQLVLPILFYKISYHFSIAILSTVLLSPKHLLKASTKSAKMNYMTLT